MFKKSLKKEVGSAPKCYGSSTLFLMLIFAGAGQNSLNGDDGGEEGGEEFISRSVRLFTIYAVKKIFSEDSFDICPPRSLKFFQETASFLLVFAFKICLDVFTCIAMKERLDM